MAGVHDAARPQGVPPALSEFAGLPGGFMHERIKDGTLVYWHSVLCKSRGLAPGCERSDNTRGRARRSGSSVAAHRGTS